MVSANKTVILVETHLKRLRTGRRCVRYFPFTELFPNTIRSILLKTC